MNRVVGPIVSAKMIVPISAAPPSINFFCQTKYCQLSNCCSKRGLAYLHPHVGVPGCFDSLSPSQPQFCRPHFPIGQAFSASGVSFRCYPASSFSPRLVTGERPRDERPPASHISIRLKLSAMTIHPIINGRDQSTATLLAKRLNVYVMFNIHLPLLRQFARLRTTSTEQCAFVTSAVATLPS
jgi:hypothetical protein